MKKSTINYILYGVMVFLVVAICILLTKIAGRTRYNDTTESATITEAPVIQETLTIPDLSKSDTSSDDNSSSSSNDDYFSPSGENTQQSPEGTVSNVLRGRTSDKVKIRELPDLDSRVLEIVDEGYSFTILEILSSGWTKISYNNGEAYISSAYVIVEQS